MKAMTRRVLPIVALASTFLLGAATVFAQIHQGVIAARGTVLRSGGQPSFGGTPTWVVYDEIGRVSREIGPKLDGQFTLSGAELRGYVTGWEDAKQFHEAENGAGSTEALSADAYRGSARCRGSSGEPIAPPSLRSSTRWALVARVPEGLPSCEGYLLFESPLPDPQATVGDVSSVLLDREWNVLDSASGEEVIALESAFYHPPGSERCAEVANNAVDPNLFSFMRCPPSAMAVDGQRYVWAPIAGAEVEIVNQDRYLGTATGPNGYYEIPIRTIDYFIYLNDRAIYEFEGDYVSGVTASIRFATWNPRIPSSRYFYLVGLPYKTGGANSFTNFGVDVIVATFLAEFRNPSGELIPAVDLEFQGEDYTLFEHTPVEPGRPIPHQGLVKQISGPDLRDTDVYLFRLSDGKLIGSRERLFPREIDAFDAGPNFPRAVVRDGCLGFSCLQISMMTRGPASRGGSGGAARYNPARTVPDGQDLQPGERVGIEVAYRDTDTPFRTFLRLGDQVKVVIVNRATGYIGTAVADVRHAGGETILVPRSGGPIILGPPNLRVHARRRPKGADRVASIGNEGGALNSDESIEITTEWYDRDGTPLPDELPGYTGRLAQVVEDGTLEPVGCAGCAQSDVGQFAISPGLRTQVISLPRERVERAHYYLHIDGAPRERLATFLASRTGRPDFQTNFVCYDDSSGGLGTCIRKMHDSPTLEQRPADFVPFYVQVFDEAATRSAMEARAALLRGTATDPANPPKLEGVEPVYRWVYSPEYQFSVYDLKMEEVEVATYFDPTHGTRTGLAFRYDLGTSPSDPLHPIFSPGDLVWGIGYEELRALTGLNQVEGHPNLDALLQMTAAQQAEVLGDLVSNLSSEDLLTLQLYRNSDRGNALYQIDGLPAVLADAQPVVLERRHPLAEFNSGVPKPEFVDDYRFVSVQVLDTAEVEVRAMLRGGQERTLVEKRRLAPGVYQFVVDPSAVMEWGSFVASEPNFDVVIEAKREEVVSRAGQVTPVHKVYIPGRIEERRDNLKVGNLVVHDVLIQDGSLRLQRGDFSIKSVGPALEFSRSYSNLGTASEDSPLGVGWSHSLDMKLYGLSTEEVETGSLPSWVRVLRGQLFRPGSVQVPEQSGWTLVNVNGTTFRSWGGQWNPERGFHGKLEAVGGELVFTSEDGTQYHYPRPVPLVPSAPTPGTASPFVSIGDALVYRVGANVMGDAGVPDGGAGGEDAGGPGGIPGGGSCTDGCCAAPSGAGQPTRVSRVVDRNGQEMRFCYDAQGRLERVTDAVGRVARLFYVEVPVTDGGSTTRLQRVEVDGGIELVFRYNAQGQLCSARRQQFTDGLDDVEDPNVREERYLYGAPGQEVDDECAVTASTEPPPDATPDPSGARSRFQFEGTTPNLVRTSTRPLPGDEPLYQHIRYHTLEDFPPDSAGYLGELRPHEMVREIELAHRPGELDSTGRLPTVGFGYELSSSRRTVVDPRGYETTYTLNAHGNPIRIDEPLGKWTTMKWSIDEGLPDNLLVERTESVAGPRVATRTVSYEYTHDADGRIESVIETGPIAGRSVETRFDTRWALPIYRRDRNGFIEEWVPDDRGNVLTYVDGAGKSWEHAYFANGLLRSKTVPGHAGAATTYEYDAFGYATRVTMPAGGTTVTAYDRRGRLRSRTDANGNTVTYRYDSLDNLTRAEHPTVTRMQMPPTLQNYHHERIELFAYDSLSNLRSETNRLGATRTYTYTARNQVKTITRSVDNATKQHTYDNNGNLLSETDWRGAANVHTYDALNRRESTTDRLGDHTMVRTYDLAGNVLSVRDYAGTITRFEYDALDRVTLEQVEGREGRRVEREYYHEGDPEKNLHKLREFRTSNGSVEKVFAIDGRYLRTSETVTGEPGTHAWRYDDAGYLVGETDEEGLVITHVPDAEGRSRFVQRTVTDDRGSRTIETEARYDGVGNVVATIDGRGRTTTITYDEWNRAVRIEDPDHFVALKTYDGEGNEVAMRDGREVWRLQERDQLGRVRRQVDGEGNVTEYARYDANGNPEEIRAPNLVTVVAYDAEDRELRVQETTSTTTSVLDGNGEPQIQQVTRVRYVDERDGMGNPTLVRDFNGHRTEYAYNAQYQPWTITDHLGQITRRTYYLNRLLESETNRRGVTTSYTYDGRNYLATVVDPVRTLAYENDALGNQRRVTDGRNIETRYEYDALHRRIETHRANVRIERLTYTDADEVETRTDGEGHVTAYTYNGRGLLERTTYPDTWEETRGYDGAGNLVQIVDAENRIRSFTYDDENRRTTETWANETTTWTYDARGNLASILRPEGTTRTLRSDGFNRLIEVEEGGLRTHYVYDAKENLRHVHAPGGVHVEYTYDALDRKTSHIQHRADGNYVTTYDVYDGEGNLEAMHDPLGREFSYDYDARSRLELATYPNLGAAANRLYALESVRWTYDGNDNVRTVAERKRSTTGAQLTDNTTIDYDDFDRPTLVTRRGRTVAYDYDDNGNRTLVQTPSGRTTYEYDSRNRLRFARVDGTQATEFRYRPDGMLDRVLYPNGTETGYAYFPTLRVQRIEHLRSSTEEVLAQLEYQYDRNGNRTQEVATIGGMTQTTQYAFDAIDRMRSFTVANPANTTTTTYTYEAYNRKTEVVQQGATTLKNRTYTYDELNRLTEVLDQGGADGSKVIAYAYDANGNTLARTDSTDPTARMEFHYNSQNQLVEAIRGPPGAGTSAGRYDYDYQGLRVRERGTERGDIDGYYDQSSILEEVSLAGGGDPGTVIAHYRYADRLLSLDSAQGRDFYHHDVLGSTVLLTTGAAETAASYRTDPWGKITESVGSTVNRQVFTGHRHDLDTGLIYMRARYYDPEVGRFLTQDSYLGESPVPPSLHRYLYAYSNPTVWWDPTGHFGLAVTSSSDRRSTTLPTRDRTEAHGRPERRAAREGRHEAEEHFKSAGFADELNSRRLRPENLGKDRERIEQEHQITWNADEKRWESTREVRLTDHPAAREAFERRYRQLGTEVQLVEMAGQVGVFMVVTGTLSRAVAVPKKPTNTAVPARVERPLIVAEEKAVAGEASASTESSVIHSPKPAELSVPSNVGAGGGQPEVVYDAAARRYRDASTGRFVSARKLPWPANRGFSSSKQGSLEPGTVIDRFGSPSGRYAGQPGATVSQRGMAQGTEAMPYQRYEVLRPLPAEIGPAAPVEAFGAEGGATQYLFERSIQDLVAQGYLKPL